MSQGIFLNQAPQIVPVITDDRDFYVNLVLALITLVAVLISMFQEPIRKWFARAKVKVEILKKPPDCHQILLTDLRTGSSLDYSLYSRIRIANQSKNNSAQNVEVFISHFWKVLKNGNKKELNTFLPMNLKWSHTHEIKTNILPSFYRYCDFGSFRKTQDGKAQPGGVVLLLDTIVQPNPVSGGVVPNIIYPGKYEFELAISGENIEPQIKKYQLSFSKWDDDEKRMTKSITLKEIYNETT